MRTYLLRYVPPIPEAGCSWGQIHIQTPNGLQVRSQVCPERIRVPGNAVWLNARSGAWPAGWWLFLERHGREGSTAKVRLLFQKILLHFFSQEWCWLKCSSGQISVESTHSNSPHGCLQTNEMLLFKLSSAAAKFTLSPQPIQQDGITFLYRQAKEKHQS